MNSRAIANLVPNQKEGLSLKIHIKIYTLPVDLNSKKYKTPQINIAIQNSRLL